jgi:transcriptional regulator with XRE-family HTH domain
MTDDPSGDELRERREALGLTQEAVARAVGVTGNTLSRWERGERPSPHALAALLRFYEDGGQVVAVTSREVGAGAAGEESPRTRFLVSDLLRVVAELVELEAGARGLPVLPADPGAPYIGTGTKLPNPNAEARRKRGGINGG